MVGVRRLGWGRGFEVNGEAMMESACLEEGMRWQKNRSGVLKDLDER